MGQHLSAGAEVSVWTNFAFEEAGKILVLHAVTYSNRRKITEPLIAKGSDLNTIIVLVETKGKHQLI